MANMNDCPEKLPLTDEYLEKMNAYWRAANYLAAAQLYMLDNPLLREPLTRDQVKKKNRRSLGYSSRTELCLYAFKQSYQKI